MDGPGKGEELEVPKKIDWWRDFFTGLTLDMWRTAISEEQTRSESEFIFSELGVQANARILDVPCGNGRITLQLAAKGLNMIGVDFSDGFLREASNASRSKGLSISFEHREMRDLPWHNEFDGAFCWGNSFGYLDDSGNADFLKAVFRTLKPGARFLLDASSVAEAILPKIQERSEMQFGDILFKEENTYDHTMGRLDTRYTFVRGHEVEERFGSHRIYTYRQIVELLESPGFRMLKSLGSLSGGPFTLGANTLVFVVEKNV